MAGRRTLLAGVALGLAALGVACALLYRFVAVPWLHAETRRLLQQDLSDMLRGRLEVDETVSVSPGLLRARGVRLFDAQGRLVAQGSRVVLTLDPLALLDGRLHFAHAEVVDPEVWLYPSDAYGVTLFEALDSAPTDTGDDTALTAALDHLVLEGARVRGDVPYVEGLASDGLDVHLDLTYADAVLSVGILSARGTLQAPYDSPLDIRRLSGRVRADEELHVRLHGELGMREDRVRFLANVETRPDDDLDVALHLRASPVTVHTLGQLQVPGHEYVRGTLRGRADVWGTASALQWQFDLQTEGGPVQARGSTPVGGTTRWRVQTSGLALHDVVVDLLPSRLSGTFSVRLPPPYDEVRLRLDASQASILGVRMQDAHARGVFDGRRLHFEQARLHHEGGDYQGSGWVGLDGDFAVELEARAPRVQRSPLLDDTGLLGAGRATLHAERIGDVYDLHGSLTIAAAHLAGIDARALKLRGTLRGKLDAPRLDLTATAGSARYGALAVERASLRLRGDRGRYDATLQAFAGHGRHFRTDAEVRLSGGGLRIRTGAGEVAVGQRRPWLASADLFVDTDHVEVYDLRLSRRRQRLEASGRYDYGKDVRVRALMERFDVAGLAELLDLDLGDLAGEGEGELEIDGPLSLPDVSLRLTVRQATFLGLTDLTVIERLDIEAGDMHSETRIVLPDASALDLRIDSEAPPGGNLATRLRDGRYRMQLELASADLRLIHPWLAYAGLPLPRGRLTGRLNVEGTLDEPSARGRLELRELYVMDFERMDVALELDAGPGGIALPSLHVEDPGGTLLDGEARVGVPLHRLTGGGTAPVDPRPLDWHVSLRVPRRKASQLPGPLRMDLDATVEGEARVGMQQGQPVGTLQAAMVIAQPVRSGRCGQPTPVRGELQLHTRDGGSEGTLRFTLDGDDELANLALSTPSTLPAWLLGETDYAPPVLEAQGQLRVRAAEDLPALCDRLAGPLRGELDAYGMFGDEPSLLLRVESPALQLAPRALRSSKLLGPSATRAYGPPLDVELNLGLSPTRLSFEGLLQDDGGGKMELYGSAPRAHLDPGAARATAIVRVADFELSPLLQQISEDVSGGGRLDGAAAITFFEADRPPRLDGELRLKEGSVLIGTLGQRLTDITGTLDFADNRVEIHELTASDFDGQIQLDGELLWLDADTLESDLDLRVRRFPVRREGRPLSHLTGEARLRGKTTAEASELNLTVRSLRVDLPGDFAGDLMPLADHPDIHVVGEAREEEAGHSPYRLDLHVLAPSFRVVRAELNAEMAAEVHATYVAPKLTLSGGAELRSGAFAMYGKRFRLQRSRIAFDEAGNLDPLVDLHATHQVGGNEIGVFVQGRLSDPQVRFTHSDPDVVEQSEILAELVAGRSSQVDEGHEANRAAASFLAGATAGFLTEEVRDEMGGLVPVIAVDQQDDQLSSTRIRAGLQLDAVISKHLGALSGFVRGVYVEGFVSPGADTDAQAQGLPTESRGGGLLELRFPRDVLGIFEYRPVSNWRVDVAWQP